VGLGLKKPNSGLEPGETDSGSYLDSDETFQISRNLGLDIDEIVCLLDSQLCFKPTMRPFSKPAMRIKKLAKRVLPKSAMQL
jgi:hypothetical protein